MCACVFSDCHIMSVCVPVYSVIVTSCYEETEVGRCFHSDTVREKKEGRMLDLGSQMVRPMSSSAHTNGWFGPLR